MSQNSRSPEEDYPWRSEPPYLRVVRLFRRRCYRGLEMKGSQYNLDSLHPTSRLVSCYCSLVVIKSECMF
jgi:hypothetical protein